MLILRTPKGWTGPREVDGQQVEDTWRSHQVPMTRGARERRATGAVLEEWLRSYRPEELFDEDGRLVPELAALAPDGERRMGANPHANGGAAPARPRASRLPRLRRGGRRRPATTTSEATRVLGGVAARRHGAATGDNFRLFGPDETASNRLGAVLEATDKTWAAEQLPVDDRASRPTAA